VDKMSNNDIIIRIKGDIEDLKGKLSNAQSLVKEFFKVQSTPPKLNPQNWEAAAGLQSWKDMLPQAEKMREEFLKTQTGGLGQDFPFNSGELNKVIDDAKNKLAELSTEVIKLGAYTQEFVDTQVGGLVEYADNVDNSKEAIQNFLNAYTNLAPNINAVNESILNNSQGMNKLAGAYGTFQKQTQSFSINSIGDAFKSLSPIVSSAGNTIVSSLSGVVSKIKEVTSTEQNMAKNVQSFKMPEQQNYIKFKVEQSSLNKVQVAITNIVSMFRETNNSVNTSLNTLEQSIRDTFTNISDDIDSKLTEARDKIKDFIKESTNAQKETKTIVDTTSWGKGNVAPSFASYKSPEMQKMMDEMNAQEPKTSIFSDLAKQATDAFTSIGGGVAGFQTEFAGALELISPEIAIVGTLMQTTSAIGEAAWGALQAAISGVQGALDAVWGAMQTGWEVAQRLWDVIVGLAQSLLELGKNLLGGVWDGLSKVGQSMTDSVMKFDDLFTASKNAGQKLAWFGFRLTMMGRQLSRGLMQPLNNAIQLFKGWEGAMTDVALGMGFLAAQGGLSSGIQDMMLGALEKLPDVGMKVVGMLSAISAFIINVGADIVNIAYPAIMDLIGALWNLWNEAKGPILAVLKTLVDRILPRLLDIIDKIGPALITGFVNGLEKGADALITVLDAVKPFLPAFMEVFGIILALSPLMSAFGEILFTLSVPLQAFGSIFSSLFGAVEPFLALFGPLGFVAQIVAFIAVIAGAKVAISSFGKTAEDMVAGVWKGIEDFVGGVAKAIDEIDWNTLWEQFAKAFAETIDAIIPILNSTLEFVLRNVSKFFGGLINVLKKVNWDEAFNKLIKILTDVWNIAAPYLKTALGTLWEMMLGFFDYALKFLSKIDWGGIWDGIATAFGKLWNLIGPYIPGLVSFIADKLMKAWTVIVGILGAIDWSGVFNGMLTVIGGLWDIVSPYIIKFINSLAGSIKGGIDNASTFNWKSLFTGLFTVVGSLWDFIQPVLVSLTNLIFSLLQGFSASLAELDWGSIVTGITNFIGSLWSVIEPYLGPIGDNLLIAFTAIFDAVIALIKTVDWNTVWDNLITAAGDVWVKIKPLVMIGLGYLLEGAAWILERIVNLPWGPIFDEILNTVGDVCADHMKAVGTIIIDSLLLSILQFAVQIMAIPAIISSTFNHLIGNLIVGALIWGKDLATNISAGIQARLKEIGADPFTSLFNALKSAIKTSMPWLATAIERIWPGSLDPSVEKSISSVGTALDLSTNSMTDFIFTSTRLNTSSKSSTSSLSTLGTAITKNINDLNATGGSIDDLTVSITALIEQWKAENAVAQSTDNIFTPLNNTIKTTKQSMDNTSYSINDATKSLTDYNKQLNTTDKTNMSTSNLDKYTTALYRAGMETENSTGSMSSYADAINKVKLNSVADLLGNYINSGEQANKISQEATGITNTYSGAIEELRRTSSLLYAHSIGDDIERNMAQAQAAMQIGRDATDNFNAGLRETISLIDMYNQSYVNMAAGAMGAVSGPTLVGPLTIDMPITFGNVNLSSSADIDYLTNEISRKIASKIEGVTRL
jgi:hypothetical protein